MGDFKWLHELVFGALVGNILLGLGFIKILYKAYRTYDTHMHQHKLMYTDYMYREQLRKDREIINRKKHQSKIQLHRAEESQDNSEGNNEDDRPSTDSIS